MKTASLHELKKEISALTPKELQELCLRLAKYKKENKELLSYLIFEAHDEEAYIRGVKKLIDEQFAELNKSHVYLAKKTIRKVLRTTNKYVKYSQNPRTEIELRIYFLSKFKSSGIAIRKAPVLANLYERQLEKINSTLKKLHEDLQNDYKSEIGSLS